MKTTRTARSKRPAKTKAPKFITLPALKEGEHYAGIVLKDSAPSHHLILLPGELESADWKKATEWAKKQGGSLPTRQEQALLFANAKHHFQPRWYWSGEQYAPASVYAWYQSFTGGGQYGFHKFTSYRARAVRRLPIQ